MPFFTTFSKTNLASINSTPDITQVTFPSLTMLQNSTFAESTYLRLARQLFPQWITHETHPLTFFVMYNTNGTNNAGSHAECRKYRQPYWIHQTEGRKKDWILDNTKQNEQDLRGSPTLPANVSTTGLTQKKSPLVETPAIRPRPRPEPLFPLFVLSWFQQMWLKVPRSYFLETNGLVLYDFTSQSDSGFKGCRSWGYWIISTTWSS